MFSWVPQQCLSPVCPGSEQHTLFSDVRIHFQFTKMFFSPMNCHYSANEHQSGFEAPEVHLSHHLNLRNHPRRGKTMVELDCQRLCGSQAIGAFCRQRELVLFATPALAVHLRGTPPVFDYQSLSMIASGCILSTILTVT